MASQLGRNTKSVGLLKQAWHEIPDIVAGTALAVGSLISMVFVYKYRKQRGDFDNRRYRFTYTVVRPGDPLARHAPPKEVKE